MGTHKHILSVDKTFLDKDRRDFYKPYVEGKNVLHVGFVDWPKPRPQKSLHLSIASWCNRLDGIDPNVDKAGALKVSNGNFYSEWSQLSDVYDVILVPEVIEHVDNIRDFLETIDKFKGILIVSAPDAFLLNHHFQLLEDGNFYELVHPDHKCWYSPYTLTNTINSFSKNRKVKSLHWLQNQSICAVCY